MSHIVDTTYPIYYSKFLKVLVFSPVNNFHGSSRNCSISQIVLTNPSPDEYIVTFCPSLEPEHLSVLKKKKYM